MLALPIDHPRDNPKGRPSNSMGLTPLIVLVFQHSRDECQDSRPDPLPRSGILTLVNSVGDGSVVLDEELCVPLHVDLFHDRHTL